jgi:hypothetical protein
VGFIQTCQEYIRANQINVTSFSVSYVLSEIEIFRFAQNDILPVTLNEVKGLLGL